MLKIFIVDDERIVRVTTADDLRDAGYSVREFASAQAALQHMNDTNEEVEVIITDLKMPGMDGLEFLTKVKATYPDIFVLLIDRKSVV